MMSKCLNTCSLKSQPWGYYFCIFPVSSDVFHLNGSSPHVMWWNWDCKRWEESDWCVHLYFVVSQLWEGFVWSWNHDSFPITLSLSQVLFWHAALSPSHCHCHSSLSFSFYSGYSWQSCLWSVKDKRTNEKFIFFLYIESQCGPVTPLTLTFFQNIFIPLKK